ncbi:glycosyltransferase family 4 protein [Salinimicrobium sp. GXAS 041]|uniref:glycosyltransferase family 4 protein n=1 Tax=Salinimicrobium sp. GXAS 041 TaxID=3400806 RepID=UPI003C759439
MRFTIITYLEHKQEEDIFYSYAPYIREMNLWLKHVDEVEVVAPLLNSPVKSTELAYASKRLFFTKIPAINLLSARYAFLAFLKLPKIILKVFKAMKRSDHIHLRCPGNIGLIACFVQIFFPKKPKTAKYAGNWDPEAKQPWSYNLQKWLLKNTFLTRNMQVLVYGDWPHQSRNIKPFFTASFSEKEKQEVLEKNFEAPFTFLFVGNLVKGKHPLQAIQLVQQINKELDLSFEPRNIILEIYGDGPEMKMLKAYCKAENIEQLIVFKGSRPLEEVKKAYQKAHFLILPSQSEGWPKAVAEAMFFGCIPVSTPVSCVPWMLDYGNRGILLSDQANGQQRMVNGSKEWPVALTRIVEIMKDAAEMKRMSEAAKQWSQQYTLERFEEAIKEVLRKV